jgi:hypothetical protein
MSASGSSTIGPSTTSTRLPRTSWCEPEPRAGGYSNTATRSTPTLFDHATGRPCHEAFEQLDELLRAERGPNGQPSATDVIVLELPAIVERFATGFDDLPEIVEGVPAGRMLIAAGMLVRAIAVFGLLTSDNTIDLIGLSLDTE